jgi:hypothetical protein
MDLSAIALQGLQQAEVQLERAASRIASTGAASPDGADLDPDFSSEMVTLMTVQNDASVSLATLKTAAEIQKSVIDLMA